MDEALTVDRPSRVRDIEGNVPLHVVVWLETHPTAALACALAATAPRVAWHYRLSPSMDVQLKGARVFVVDTASGHKVGSARIHGVRSADDFDALPRAFEPPPFTPPDPIYPATYGFACDLDGRVARFAPIDGRSSVGPGLPPRATSYPHSEPKMDALVTALATRHANPAHPIAAFAVRVRELVNVLRLPTVVGSSRAFTWFEDDRVVVWPESPNELAALVVSALHARGTCLGCSRFDPRDAIARGTYRYGRPSHSRLESLVREDVPIEPLDVAGAAALLGRSPAELGATQLSVRFADTTRVDVGQLKRAD